MRQLKITRGAADFVGAVAGERPSLISLSLGAATVLALPPFSIPIVLPFTFSGLFILTAGLVVPAAFRIGFMFGLGYFVVGLSWITESFYIDAVMSDNQVGLYRQPSWPLPAAGGRA